MNSETSTIVADVIREALFLPDDAKVSHEQLLFDDLACSSMSFLDLLFRLEDRFGITLPDRALQDIARGDLTPEEFAEGGVILTPAGRRRLMELLSETPAELFPAEIHLATLPRYFTVGALVRLVDHRRAESQTCSS